LKLIFPPAFRDIFRPYRNKVFYGGRGGGKSQSIARYLLVAAAKERHRILCCREIQQSIKDSVHKLLSDVISEVPAFTQHYKVYHDRIEGKNGSEFIFKGLRHNSTEIKSTEGCTKAWVEEAQIVSDESWETLIPTIRVSGSEIIASFNPKNPTDPVYKRFVAIPDPDTLVVKVNWNDNPFFPEVLNLERIKLQKNDPKAYAHIWEGEFDTRHNGAVYADLIQKAREQGRITNVPPQTGQRVFTGWDLGKRDATAIWFAQWAGLEPRIIDYYENSSQGLEHYAEVIKQKGYTYGYHYLPHDGSHDRLGMKGSIASQLKDMGLNAKVIPLAKDSTRKAGIELARGILPQAWIDAKKCENGLHSLTHYHYEYDEARKVFKNDPLHDWSSHGADAFRTLAHAFDKERMQPLSEDVEDVIIDFATTDSWMAI